MVNVSTTRSMHTLASMVQTARRAQNVFLEPLAFCASARARTCARGRALGHPTLSHGPTFISPHQSVRTIPSRSVPLFLCSCSAPRFFSFSPQRLAPAPWRTPAPSRPGGARRRGDQEGDLQLQGPLDRVRHGVVPPVSAHSCSPTVGYVQRARMHSITTS